MKKPVTPIDYSLYAGRWIAIVRSCSGGRSHGGRSALASQGLAPEGRSAGGVRAEATSARGPWVVPCAMCCWAHLKRDFQALVERGGESERIGRALLEQVEKMFGLWHRV